MTEDQAMAAARHEAEGRAGDRLLDQLVDRIGGRSGVQAVFGEPIERAGTTVIPVARVRWLVGAGMGSGPVAGGDPNVTAGGSGGGGGATSVPVGYIEIGPSGAAFHTIAEAYPSPLFLIAAGITAGMLLRGIARLLRG